MLDHKQAQTMRRDARVACSAAANTFAAISWALLALGLWSALAGTVLSGPVALLVVS
ncbi:MAG TPA: hypothetical protein VEX18_11190 [Polyangiaceae bacterium]|nr:hypothetical protein [Polyangiaceae bacterium]